MTRKQRLSVSVDADLAKAARAAVRARRAASVSAWVEDALRRQVDHDARLAAAWEWIHAYEAVHGEITEQDMEAAKRRLRSSAVVVRPKKDPKRKPPRRKGAA